MAQAGRPRSSAVVLHGRDKDFPPILLSSEYWGFVPKEKADHSLSSSAKLQNAWSYTAIQRMFLRRGG
jgi:hypothetical protein